MLEKLKKNMGTDGRDRGTFKKIVALLVFGFIILVFVFMDMTPEQLGGGSGAGVVAQVNDTSISANQLRDMMRRMEQRFGGGNASLQDFIQNQALETLIEREVMYQGIEKAGLMVSDGEIRDIIVNIPAFQDEGRFRRTYYENYLRGTRQTAGKFEMEVRKDAASQRLRTALTTAMLPISAEVARDKEMKKKKARLEYLQFTEADLVKTLSVKTRTYPQDEAFKAEVRKYYDENKAEFSTKEEVSAQHILIKAKAGDAKDEVRAKKRIDEIAQRVQKEDFAKVAKEVSDDTGSKVKGGDLGFFGRGQMVKPFEEKAFSMRPGEISEPVKSAFGYHLIKVLARKEAKTAPFELAQIKISKKLETRRKVKAAVEELKTALVNGDMNGLNKFKSWTGLKWNKTANFDLAAASVPGIGANEELLKEAFKLKNGEVAKRIFLVSGKSYLIRPVAVEDSQKDDLPKEERGEIIAALGQDKAFDVLGRIRKDWKEASEIQRRQLQ